MGALTQTESGRRARGFTLLEMLITLVIVSLVAGIVWQAMGHLARIERLLEQSQLRGLAQAVRAEWVRSALTSLLPGSLKTHDLFQGSATELKGVSAEAPVWPAPGLAYFRFRLLHDPVSDMTALQVLGEVAPPQAPGDGYTTLLSWQGREGKFSYLNEQGQWRDTWPPLGTGKPPPALPQAVMVETGLVDLRLIVATTLASPVQLPSRVELESW